MSLVSRMGLPRIRLHDLRHTHATLALAAGVEIKIVSDRLGHSQISVTADLYTQVTRGVARTAANQIADVLRGANDAIPTDSLQKSAQTATAAGVSDGSSSRQGGQKTKSPDSRGDSSAFRSSMLNRREVQYLVARQALSRIQRPRQITTRERSGLAVD